MKNIARVSIALLILITISITACGTNTGNLENKTWVLESYGNKGNLKAVLEDTEITVTFDSEKGQVSGSSGCNSYGGGYDLDQDKLTIPGPLMGTAMACPEPIMEQEMEYLKALQEAESYKIDSNQLQITSGDNVLIFKLK